MICPILVLCGKPEKVHVNQLCSKELYYIKYCWYIYGFIGEYKYQSHEVITFANEIYISSKTDIYKIVFDK